MFINVTDENGVLLDRVEVSREDFLKAQNNGFAAAMLLREISIGEYVG